MNLPGVHTHTHKMPFVLKFFPTTNNTSTLYYMNSFKTFEDSW